MSHHERQKCARDRQLATKLLDISTEISGSRNLIEAAAMAAHKLTQHQRDPLVELLTMVSERLQQIATNIVAEVQSGEADDAA